MFWVGVTISAHVLFACLLPSHTTPASNTSLEIATWHNSVPCGKLNQAQGSAASSVLASVGAWKVHTLVPPVHTPFDLEGIKNQGLYCLENLYWDWPRKALGKFTFYEEPSGDVMEDELGFEIPDTDVHKKMQITLQIRKINMDKVSEPCSSWRRGRETGNTQCQHHWLTAALLGL